MLAIWPGGKRANCASLLALAEFTPEAEQNGLTAGHERCLLQGPRPRGPAKCYDSVRRSLSGEIWANVSEAGAAGSWLRRSKV